MKTIITIFLFSIGVIGNAAPMMNGEQITVLKGASKMMGPFASWAVNEGGNNYGHVCSRLYGLANKETNMIESSCKVCFSKRYSHENWPEGAPQLIAGESIEIEMTSEGGANYISESYGCYFDNTGSIGCRGDNFKYTGRTSQSKKEINIMCTSDKKFTVDTLNEIFKGKLSFPKRKEFNLRDYTRIN